MYTGADIDARGGPTIDRLAFSNSPSTPVYYFAAAAMSGSTNKGNIEELSVVVISRHTKLILAAKFSFVMTASLSSSR